MTYIKPNPGPFSPINNGMWTSSIPTATVVQTNTPNLGAAFKPKKAGKNTSHIVFLLDDSGSMQSCRDQTISGFNEFLDGQIQDAKDTGIKTFVSLYKFDGSSLNSVFDHMDVNEVQKLSRRNYNPRGGTNLLDAMGGVMMKINTILSETKKDKRESVIVVALTDGEENSSRTFRNDDIKQMVEKAEAKNWGFMFLGANVDAFAVGAQFGFSHHNTMQYDTSNMGATMRSASAMSSRMKTAYAGGMDTNLAYASSAFTDVERDVSGGGE